MPDCGGHRESEAEPQGRGDGLTRQSRGLRPGYLPLREAARWAGVSPRTLKRWIRRGLPTFQAGPREKVLVRPKDIDNFLVRREKPQISLDAIVEETISSLVTGA